MFTKLEQLSWIKTEVAQDRSTQECFRGLRESFSGTEPHHSSWQCKESHRCCCHGPLVPLAIGDSGTSIVLTLYGSMRLWSLRQSERTTARDPVQHQRWTFTCCRAFCTKWQWEILEHPQYSPDMSPWHYDLFAKVKEPLRGTRYNTRNELTLAVRRFVRNGNGRFWNIHHTHPIWVHVIIITLPKWKNHCEGPSTTQLLYVDRN